MANVVEMIRHATTALVICGEMPQWYVESVTVTHGATAVTEKKLSLLIT